MTQLCNISCFQCVLRLTKSLEVPLNEGQLIGTAILQLNNISVIRTHFENRGGGSY